MWSSGVKSSSVLGIAGNCPEAKPGTACGNTQLGSRSGLFALLRYRVHQLVSSVSFMRLVSRGFPLEPLALLPGKVRNCSRLAGAAPFDTRYAFKNVK